MTRAPATEGGGLMLPLPGALRLRRFDGARSLNTGRAAGKRQQGDVAGPLDGHAQPPLVTRANARHAAGQNFAALLHELRKNVGALVVDEIHLIDAELANLLLAKILALATAQADGTSGATFATAATRTAFAARTTGVRVTTLAARGASAFRPSRAAGAAGAAGPCFCSSDITSYLSSVQSQKSIKNWADLNVRPLQRRPIPLPGNQKAAAA